MDSALRRGADLNYHRESTGWMSMTYSPIIHAVRNRQIAAVEFLLEKGVWLGPTETSDFGNPLLLISAGTPYYPESVAITRHLLRRGANIQAQGPDGFTAIECAVSSSSPGEGHVQMATLLAVHGASTAGLRSKIEDVRTKFTCEYHQSATYDEMMERRGPAWQQLLEWADSVDGCPPFQVAIAHGLHADATAALQLGHIDPADCSDRTEEIHKAAAETACLATISLAKLALAEWSPQNHHLYYLKPETRAAIKTVLLVCNRKQITTGVADVPVLLPDLWKRIIGFVARRNE